MGYIEQREVLELEKMRLENEHLSLKIEQEKKDRERKPDYSYDIERRIEQARHTVSILLPYWIGFLDKGQSQDLLGIRAIIEANLKILYDVNKIGKDIGHVSELDHFDFSQRHLTADDIKHALANTDVLSVINKARRNGWIISLDGMVVRVRRAGKSKDGFVPCMDSKIIVDNKLPNKIKSRKKRG